VEGIEVCVFAEAGVDLESQFYQEFYFMNEIMFFVV